MYRVSWIDRKGAGCMRQFRDNPECLSFIAKLRCRATVRNQEGQVIGGIYDRTKDDPLLAADTTKAKWIYWLENQS